MDLEAHPLFSLHPAPAANIIEYRGQRIPLPGVATCEPLTRGCDQREWLMNLAGMGIRHLVLNLNGAHEDSCVFTRRHLDAGPLYDLDRRDEGVFTRLQFLLEAAGALGIMVGISLCDVSLTDDGPFCAERNEQNVGFRVSGFGFSDAALHKTRNPKPETRNPSVESLRAHLRAVAGWVAAELRGRATVWVEVFRGGDSFLREAGGSPNALGVLEQELIRYLAAQLVRPALTEEASQFGPWVSAPSDFEWPAEQSAAGAPFVVRHGASPQRDGAGPDAARSTLYHFANPSPTPPRGQGGAVALDRTVLWHAALRGCWPLVPGAMADADALRLWQTVAEIARFAQRWTARGRVRPAPEVLAPLSDRARKHISAAAATDGAGRYFVYVNDKITSGLLLATLPGSYRWYWIDPRMGRAVDHGDGVEGGARCAVPGNGRLKEGLLVLEQAEVPDPLTNWAMT